MNFKAYYANGTFSAVSGPIDTEKIAKLLAIMPWYGKLTGGNVVPDNIAPFELKNTVVANNFGDGPYVFTSPDAMYGSMIRLYKVSPTPNQDPTIVPFKITHLRGTIDSTWRYGLVSGGNPRITDWRNYWPGPSSAAPYDNSNYLSMFGSLHRKPSMRMRLGYKDQNNISQQGNIPGMTYGLTTVGQPIERDRVNVKAFNAGFDTIQADNIDINFSGIPSYTALGVDWDLQQGPVDISRILWGANSGVLTYTNTFNYFMEMSVDDSALNNISGERIYAVFPLSFLSSSSLSDLFHAGYTQNGTIITDVNIQDAYSGGRPQIPLAAKYVAIAIEGLQNNVMRGGGNSLTPMRLQANSGTAAGAVISTINSWNTAGLSNNEILR